MNQNLNLAKIQFKTSFHLQLLLAQYVYKRGDTCQENVYFQHLTFT